MRGHEFTKRRGKPKNSSYFHKCSLILRLFNFKIEIIAILPFKS